MKPNQATRTTRLPARGALLILAAAFLLPATAIARWPIVNVFPLRFSRWARLIFTGFALGLLVSPSALAQAPGDVSIQVKFPEDLSGTPVDLHRMKMGDVLKQGAEVTMEAEAPVEVVLVVGVVQGGQILTQYQSEPFILDGGTYLLSESEGDFVINKQNLQSGLIEPAVTRLDAPHLDLGMQHGTTGRFGDPHAMHFEPHLVDYTDPLKRFEGEGWDGITEESDIDPGASIFVLMVVPTNERMRQEAQTDYEAIILRY